jgi:hypothetical protein
LRATEALLCFERLLACIVLSLTDCASDSRPLAKCAIGVGPPLGFDEGDLEYFDSHATTVMNSENCSILTSTEGDSVYTDWYLQEDIYAYNRSSNMLGYDNLASF